MADINVSSLLTGRSVLSARPYAGSNEQLAGRMVLELSDLTETVVSAEEAIALGVTLETAPAAQEAAPAPEAAAAAPGEAALGVDEKPKSRKRKVA